MIAKRLERERSLEAEQDNTLLRSLEDLALKRKSSKSRLNSKRINTSKSYRKIQRDISNSKSKGTSSKKQDHLPRFLTENEEGELDDYSPFRRRGLFDTEEAIKQEFRRSIEKVVSNGS